MYVIAAKLIDIQDRYDLERTPGQATAEVFFSGARSSHCMATEDECIL